MWLLLVLIYGLGQIVILFFSWFNMRHPFEHDICILYICSLKVENYIFFLYEESVYTRYNIFCVSKISKQTAMRSS